MTETIQETKVVETTSGINYREILVLFIYGLVFTLIIEGLVFIGATIINSLSESLGVISSIVGALVTLLALVAILGVLSLFLSRYTEETESELVPMTILQHGFMLTVFGFFIFLVIDGFSTMGYEESGALTPGLGLVWVILLNFVVQPLVIGSVFRNPEKWSDALQGKLSDIGVQKQIAWALGSVLLAMFIGAVILMMSGYNAGLAMLVLIREGVIRWDRILYNATPLIFTGLSVALAFKCGLFNIGPEGQLYIGSIVATAVGYLVALPLVVHPVVALFLAAFCGFLWGLLPGILKAYRGAHEVVTTMMLTYIAINLTSWLVSEGGPMFLQGQIEPSPRSPDIFFSAELPKLFGSFLNVGFLIALLAVVFVQFLITRTVLGYELRAVGSNMEAAENAGINSKVNVALALGFSGALAGMGGAIEIQGYHHRFRTGWSAGYGWDGITVAVLGGNNPLGVLLAALFFGFLKTGGLGMQRVAGVPIEIVGVIQGLLVLFIAAPRLIDWLANRGISYGEWAMEMKAKASPNIIALILGFVSGLMGLGFATGLMTTPFGFVYIIIALFSLYSFMSLYTQESDSSLTMQIASVCWLIVGVLIFISGYGTTGILSIFIGALGLVLMIIEMIMSKEVPIYEGGVA